MQGKSSYESIRVGLFSTEPIRLTGLHSVLEDYPGIAVVTGDFESLLEDESLEYLILDMGNNPAWMEIQFMARRLRPDIRQIVLGPSGSEELILQSIGSGARAYLDSSCGPLAVRQAVGAVIQGSIWAPRRLLSMLVDRLMSRSSPSVAIPSPTFSPRERQVLDLIMTARSNREIAEELGIEERTVKAYVTSLMRKTGVDNRVSLSVRAMQGSLREQRTLPL
jgi:DNA-binding NarL/FixJ family response regulator